MIGIVTCCLTAALLTCIAYFPVSLSHLNFYTFSAQGNPTITEEQKRQATRSPTQSLPSLLELAARVIVSKRVQWSADNLPDHLESKLYMSKGQLLNNMLLCLSLYCLQNCSPALSIAAIVEDLFSLTSPPPSHSTPWAPTTGCLSFSSTALHTNRTSSAGD